MNESARTPAPDFSEQLNALAEDMADGLGRQLAIDRLVDLGLSEEEADDQEAAIREQLRAIHRGTHAIFRDLDRGLTRQQAVARFQELGLSREEAVTALEDYRGRREASLSETREILHGIHTGLSRDEAIARFRGLGLDPRAAEQFVGLRFDVTAYWYREHIWIGGLAGLIGLLLVVLLAGVGSQPAVAFLIPGVMVVYGACFAWIGRHRRNRYRAPKATAPGEPATPFELVCRGHGRHRAILSAMDAGVAPTEAGALINSSLDSMVRLYRWFVALGLLTLVWGLFLFKDMWGLEWMNIERNLGSLALVVWGVTGTVRGVLGWRRFGKR